MSNCSGAAFVGILVLMAASGAVIMDAPPGAWTCARGPMPKPAKPKTIF